MSYHKTPTPTPKQDNIHYMMMSAAQTSCEIRDITLNGKDEDIVRAFREKGLKDTCPYIVIPTLRVGDYVMIHIEDMVLTRVGVYHV